MNNFNNQNVKCRLDIINNNYNNILNSEELEHDFDIDTQAPFSEILKQNKYYDDMYSHLKANKHYFNSQFQSMSLDDFKRYNQNKESYGHFQFPDRSLKSFVELDEINRNTNCEHTYLLKKLAEKKYHNVYSTYNMPYQYVKEQNEIGNTFTTNGGFISNDKISPYNENWALDDKEEKKIVGAVDKDDSMLYSVNGGLITTNREFLDRIDPKLLEIKKKSLGYVEPTTNTPIPNPTRYVPRTTTRTPRPPRPTKDIIIDMRGFLN
jgi:hypothetical protein